MAEPAGKIVVDETGVRVEASGFIGGDLFTLALHSTPVAPNKSRKSVNISGYATADDDGNILVGPWPTNFIIPDEPRVIQVALHSQSLDLETHYP